MLIIVFITSTFTTPRLNAKTNNYKYAKTTVNVRKKPNKKSKIVGKLYWNDKVKAIKKVNKKWYKVKYKKKIRYIYQRQKYDTEMIVANMCLMFRIFQRAMLDLEML